MAVPLPHASTKIPDTTKGKSFVLVPPVGSVKGDSLYVAFQLQAKLAIVPPAGWIEIATQRIAAIEEWSCGVFCLPNWDGVTTEYAFGWGGSEKFYGAIVFAVEGSDETKPINAASGVQIHENTPASTAAPIPAYSTTTKECRLVGIVFNNEGFQYSPGAGYTELADQAGGPEVVYKTEGVEAGAQAEYKSTSASAVTLTIGFAIQPPQPKPTPVPTEPAGRRATRGLIMR